jgi:hypothetical protein
VTFYAWRMLVESVRLRLARSASAAGAFASAFLVTNDPFARFRKAPDKAAELPVGSNVAPAWHTSSTPLSRARSVSRSSRRSRSCFQPTLSALLAGLLAGMGVVSLVALYGIDGRLYLDPRTGGVFRKVT